VQPQQGLGASHRTQRRGEAHREAGDRDQQHEQQRTAGVPACGRDDDRQCIEREQEQRARVA
jgi:hypothetical protein